MNEKQTQKSERVRGHMDEERLVIAGALIAAEIDRINQTNSTK